MTRSTSILLLAISTMLVVYSCEQPETSEKKPEKQAEGTSDSDTCACNSLMLSEDRTYFYLDNEKDPYDGVCQDLFSNGKVERIKHLQDGRNHGLSMTFYDNGQMKDSSTYDRNLKVGETKSFSKSGVLKYHALYENGQLKEVYHSDLKHPDLDEL